MHAFLVASWSPPTARVAWVAALAVTFAAANLLAQADRLTAHPQDVPHIATGQANPFGNHPSFCEARCQLLVRAQHLPGPGAELLGIEVHPLALAGSVTYESLTITVSPVSPTATRSAAFASNLPAPTTVVQLTNHTENWPASGWQRIATTSPYVHDGVSSLTIDIQKDAVPGIFWDGYCTGLFRPDLEPMYSKHGPSGSGRHLAPIAGVAVIPIDVRLVWAAVPTAVLRSPIPGINHHGFVIGSTVDHVVTTTPFSPLWRLVDVQWSAPSTLPFALGEWHVHGLLIGPDFAGASGESVATFTIPNQLQLIGQQVTWQALVIDAQNGAWQFTNGCDCFLAQ